MTDRYSTISIEQVISRIKLKLRLQNTTEFDDMFETLICEGLDSLNASSQQGKFECEVEVCGQTAKLPKGLIRFLAAQLPCDASVTNNPINDQTINLQRQIPMIYADLTFLNQCGCNVTGWRPFTNTIQINNGHIHFNMDLGVDKIVIAWLGLKVDEFGNSVIFQRYERALTNYACAEYADSFKENFTEGQIQRYYATWVAQKSKIEGEDRMNDFQNDRVEISFLMSRLLVSRSTLLYP